MSEETELKGCNKIKFLLLWIAYCGYRRECKVHLRTAKSFEKWLEEDVLGE
ncbi:MAG: hypothetical protein JSV36_16055 [Anaerolineae bacterium]|nr:MAG: hypothetical protein JSV36_16055 [Anaerolineae bacterium]